jgi:hypothetical protein
MAKVFWARVNNKDINSLTKADEAKFLADFKGVNWDNYYDVINHKVGGLQQTIGDHGRHLINSELVKMVQDSNAALESQVDIDKIKKDKATLFDSAKQTIDKDFKDVNLQEILVGLGIDNTTISRKSLGEWQAEINKAVMDPAKKRAAEAFVVRYGDYIKAHGLPHFDPTVKELRGSEDKLQTNYAQGFTGVIQAINAGEKDPRKLMAIGLGLDINGTWSYKDAVSVNKQLINEAWEAIQSNDPNKMLTVAKKLQENGLFTIRTAEREPVESKRADVAKETDETGKPRSPAVEVAARTKGEGSEGKGTETSVKNIENKLASIETSLSLIWGSFNIFTSTGARMLNKLFNGRP